MCWVCFRTQIQLEVVVRTEGIGTEEQFLQNNGMLQYYTAAGRRRRIGLVSNSGLISNKQNKSDKQKQSSVACKVLLFVSVVQQRREPAAALEEKNMCGGRQRMKGGNRKGGNRLSKFELN